MSDFNNVLGNLIASNNKQGMLDWITEMENTLRYTEPSREDAKILKRRIRTIKDYLKDDEESERNI